MRKGSRRTQFFKDLLNRFSYECNSEAVQAAALREVERRATLGGVVYLACWLGIAFSTGVGPGMTEAFWPVTLTLGLILVLRVVVHLIFEKLLAYDHSLARFLFLALVLGAGLTFGLATMKSMVDPMLLPMKYPMVLVCGVLCTAATLLMSLDPMIRYGMPTVMLSPFSIGLAFDHSGLDVTLMVLLAVNLIYLFKASGHAHRDYWRAVNSQLLLHKQAGLMEALSRTDPLTSLPNRMSLENQLSQAWDRAAEIRQHLTVMMIDIDHFKSINDRYGHPFGDECLKAVAEALHRVLNREGDFVARYGGEEFVAVVRGAPKPEGSTAELLRTAVSTVRLRHEDRTVSITCSIGVLVASPSNCTMTADMAIDRADKALYIAKRSGRNKVVYWSEGSKIEDA